MTAADAAFVPVTYSVSDARLSRLTRRKLWRSRPLGWFLTWVLVVLNVGLFLLLWVAAVFMLFSFVGTFVPLIFQVLHQSFERTLGLSNELAVVLAIALTIGIFLFFFFGGMALIRRLFRARHAARVDTTITLSPVATGLHVATKELEFFLKWIGIHELLAEPDGIVVVCGGAYFLVPDRAFASADARRAFLDHVTAHLTPEARARSETEVRRARRK
jgi:hypothetical protein